jgi:hypothetical protein
VDRKEHYQEMAAQCLNLAQNVQNQTSKALLLQMAEAWLRLAERVRNSEIDVVDSDPEDR